MAIYYVDSLAGNNANDGSTPALAKATLNGAEDIPVAAGDTVRVRGNTTYREQLTCDVSGGSGAEIVYEADVAGVYWPGSAGPVRITGSDNDLTKTRDNGIYTTSTRQYRTFRGFNIDSCSNWGIGVIGGDLKHWVIEDCKFINNGCGIGLWNSVSVLEDITIRRCRFYCKNEGIRFYAGSQQTALTTLVENCIFVGGNYGIRFWSVDGVIGRNLSFIGGMTAVYTYTFTAGKSCYLYNSIFAHCYFGIECDVTDGIISDYIDMDVFTTNYKNCSAGAHSVTYAVFLEEPLSLSGYTYPSPALGALAPHTTVKAATDDGSAPTDDINGVLRPATNGKRSWGAVQYQPISRETTTTYDSSAASLKLSDAGEVQFRVAVTAVETTISVRAYREADYAGTNPRMVIKQPGQSDRTTTDVGDAGEWNELTDTFTPAASPGYVFIVLQSLNTATSGNYDTFFDSIVVS